MGKSRKFVPGQTVCIDLGSCGIFDNMLRVDGAELTGYGSAIYLGEDVERRERLIAMGRDPQYGPPMDMRPQRFHKVRLPFEVQFRFGWGAFEKRSPATTEISVITKRIWR